MSDSEVKTHRKRISNRRTRKHSVAILHSLSAGRKGTIQSLWKHPQNPFTFYEAREQPGGSSSYSERDLSELALYFWSIEFHLERGELERACYLAGMHDIHDVAVDRV